MSKDSETKALVPVEATEERNASLASFLGKFDMSMPFTPENLQMVTEQAQVTIRLHGAMEQVCVVAHGKHFIWMKAGLKHGAWAEHLKTYFSGIPVRTIQRWMAEARYYMEYGKRKCANVALLDAPNMAHFGEDEGEDLDADDLADPSKPAPKPRVDLEYRIGQLETRLKAADKNREKLLNERDDIARRLRDAERKKDPDEIDEENTPIKSALLKALLASGRARMLIQDAVNMKIDIFGDCPAKVLASVQSQLQTNIQTICDLGRPLLLAAVMEHNRKKKAESEKEKKS
jgi:hypothetical protein